MKEAGRRASYTEDAQLGFVIENPFSFPSSSSGEPSWPTATSPQPSDSLPCSVAALQEDEGPVGALPTPGHGLGLATVLGTNQSQEMQWNFCWDSGERNIHSFSLIPNAKDAAL